FFFSSAVHHVLIHTFPTRRSFDLAYFDKLFIEGDTSLLTPTNRYEVYEDKPVRKFNFNIRGLNGSYKVSRYTLNRESGSVFDERSEEHTSELQSRFDLVCRLQLE